MFGHLCGSLYKKIVRRERDGCLRIPRRSPGRRDSANDQRHPVFLNTPDLPLKFTVIGFVIWVGCFLFGYRVTFSQCWGVAIVSEFIFLLPEVLKIGWFLFAETDPDLNDIRAFYPLSVMNFFDYTEIDKRYHYPLKALNLFEIVYWVLLAWGIQFFTRKGWKSACIIVACSYIFIFFLWLLFYIIVYK